MQLCKQVQSALGDSEELCYMHEREFEEILEAQRLRSLRRDVRRAGVAARLAAAAAAAAPEAAPSV